MQPMRAGPSWKGQAVGPTGPDKQIEWGVASVTKSVDSCCIHVPKEGFVGKEGALGLSDTPLVWRRLTLTQQ